MNSPQQVFRILVVLLFAFAQIVSCKVWQLVDLYDSRNFFSNFSFFTNPDPTNGYVEYVGETEARQLNLIGAKNDQFFMRVDASGIATPPGRKSIRVHSKKTYNSYLAVLDLSHLPFGCGTWPAFWSTQSPWPDKGEIDIIEGVNIQSAVQSTLHTNQGCNMSNVPTSSFTGHWSQSRSGPATNCWIDAPNQSQNEGCGIIGASGTMGNQFNLANGGVYAAQWDAEGIKLWAWVRPNVPKQFDQPAQQLNPSEWGIPYANFEFGPNCPSSHFTDHTIIFDTTLCGGWAGSVFSNQCPGKGSCVDFVKNNPSAFTEAYWMIKYLTVYQ